MTAGERGRRVEQLGRAIGRMLERYGAAEHRCGIYASDDDLREFWSRTASRRMRSVHRLVDALERVAVTR